MTISNDRLHSVFVSSLLFLFGFGICHYYGKYAFMPLDNSPVFDGAWRILSGQVPFRDFNLPFGVPVIYFQAVFFKLFGVGLSSCLMHSSLFNGFFSALVFNLLRRAGLPQLISAFYGLASAVVFYPPIGWPYWEHHSYFFLVLGMYFLFFGNESRLKVFAGLLFFWMAFLSKQSPAAFGIFFFLFIHIFSTKKRVLSRIGALVVCSLLLALLTMLAMHLADIKFSDLIYNMIELPASIGSRRAGKLSAHDLVNIAVFPFAGNSSDFNLLTYYAFLIGSGFVVITRFRRLHEVRELFFIATACYVTCAIYMRLTNNQNEIGMALVFLAFGLFSRVLFILYHKKLAQWLVLGLITVTIYDLVHFTYQVNDTRLSADLKSTNIREMPAIDSFPEKLKPLRWAIPEEYHMSADGFIRLVNRLKSDPNNFFLLGDFSLLYGLTEKPSILPALFLHSGLTTPEKELPAFGAFEDRLLLNFEKYRVRTVVLEGQRTWMAFTLKDFPKLRYIISKYSCGDELFDPYHIIKLCDLPTPLTSPLMRPIVDRVDGPGS